MLVMSLKVMEGEERGENPAGGKLPWSPALSIHPVMTETNPQKNTDSVCYSMPGIPM